MPIPFKGVINGEVLSQVYNLPFKISFMNVANLNAGNTTVNISVTNGVTDVYIAPNDLVLSEGDMLQGDSAQIMEAGNQIRVSTNASVSYYFTIENIQAD